MPPSSAASDEAAILNDVRTLYRSPLIRQIREAFSHRLEAKVRIGRYYIQYEPDVPASISAMTDFAGSGFTLGAHAFSSEDEFKKTLLHEMYRLRMSAIGQGKAVEPKNANVRIETDAAFEFAERYYKQL
ncbi:MAG TPA: hypothetical protein VL523_08110 [Terriglobia bacterium]|nr:hypothetical protein [Terriglobia bacterium]